MSAALTQSRDGFDRVRDILPSDVLCAIFAQAGPPFSRLSAVCRRFEQVLRERLQFVWFLCIELRYALDLSSALVLARRADAIQRQRTTLFSLSLFLLLKKFSFFFFFFFFFFQKVWQRRGSDKSPSAQ
jgi:hypothetical protein